MHTRTKIICTIGPSVRSYEKILHLIDAGMNVARLNFSHGTHAEHAEVIAWLKKARTERGVPLAIMIDTKGPEIRVGKIVGGEVQLEEGKEVRLTAEVIEGNSSRIPITPAIALAPLVPGTKVLFDDGYIISTVVRREGDDVVIRISNPGTLKSKKGVNIPSVNVELPAMTKQDVADIIFGCKEDVDLIAASFIRSSDHILEIKKLLRENKKSDILVLAKIENSLGVQNFNDIVQVADGIMVARGDLGVELPLEEVPRLQKMMIRKCYQVGKPVITATQMLESMIQHPRPTRAEVSDVANAIYDSTSAVMLSGETAVGAYPTQAVKMMHSIAQESEKDFDYRYFFEHDSKVDYHDVSTSVSLATVKTAYSAGAKAIFVFTSGGFTARLVSRFRPVMPIIALTSNEKVYHQMALNWGVIPVPPQAATNAQEAFTIVSAYAMEQKLVQYGDLVVVTAGSHFGVSGTTNMMLVESIGDVLVRGNPRPGQRVHGKIAFMHTQEEKKAVSFQGKIVVLAHYDESYFSLLQNAAGIILQNYPDDRHSETHAINAALALDIPILVRADGAMHLLREGEAVTLDPQKGLIYKGKVENTER